VKNPLLLLVTGLLIVILAWAVWQYLLKSSVDFAPNAKTKGAGTSQPPGRLSYEESCAVLQQIGYLQKGLIPPRPNHRPQFDDEEPLGLNFFRTSVRDGNMVNMTLSRTYFGRSDVGPMSFKNTDLSESTLCWNDFKKVDFTDADLSKSDLRGSQFFQVVFLRTNLSDADLRRSTFEQCLFTDAKMTGAKLTQKQAKVFTFSNKQREEINWQDSEGDEPNGG
jgi:uncharacterized protein YjbI with pentapeptide repeats